MAEQTKNIPFASYPSTVKVRVGDGDLGASYMEMRRQEKITADEELVKEAYKASGFPGELGSPEVAPEELDLGGDIDVGAEDTTTPKPDDGLGFLGIAQQILVGGGLDAVKNTADLVTDTGEQLRNYEIGGATVEQHLQSVDEALGTGKLFSGKTEIGIGTLEKEGGAGVQMARGLVSWLVGFAALKGGGAATVPAGIAADGLAIDRDANLSNLFNDTFPEGHPLRNPLTDALAASKDDSELEKSVKSMVEGFGLTLPFTAIQAISRSLSSFKKTRVKAKQSIKDSGGLPPEGPPPPGTDIPAPKPTGPKVSATFDGKEYNITDMELRFDDVNPQKKIDKVQTKFDEITEKIKEDPAKGKNKKGRDVRTLAETELQARKELQADPEGQLKELMEKDPTTTITDKDRVKMALFQEASVRKLIELRNAFNAGDSTAVQKAFDQGIFTTDLFEQAQRFSETASRDLGSGRIAKQLKRTEGNIIVDKFAVVRKDIDPNVSPESFMRKLGSIEGATDSAIEKMLSNWMGETVRLGGFDMIFEAWINSLFGVKTQVVNALGSVINMGFQVTETKIAEGIRSVKRGFGATGKGVEQGEAFEMLYGILRSAPDNIIALTKNAVNIATGREVATSRFNKLDATGVRAIRGDNVPALVAMKESGSRTGNVLYKGMDIAGHFLTSMGKGLLTIDEGFKFSAYQASKHRLAYRTAIEEGITDPVALELRIRQLVNEPSPSIKAESEEFARIATFTNQAGEVGTAFQALLKAAPAAKIIVPFFNVLNNIAKFTGTRTPLAVLSKNVRADLAAGGARADMAQARLASGTMASLGFLALAMGGGMTGSEPTNKAHRESFRRKKKQPFSFEFRHEDGTRTSISYNRLEPAAFFAGIMADFVKISGELEEGEIDTFVGAYTLAVSKHFLSQTFAVGVSDFLSMGIEGDDKWLRSLGSSMLPFNGIMSDIEKTLDPDLRDTNTFDRTIFQDAFVKQYGENEGKALANSLSELTKVIGRLKSRVPEFSEDLPSRLDAFGEVITTEYGFENPIINTMNPFAMSTIVPNSLEDWITAVNANIVTPEPQIAGVMLTPEEFHDYKKLGGQAAKKALLKMIAKPNWSGPNGKKDYVKKAMMEQRFSDEYEKAANKMLSESRPILDKDGTSKKYAALIKAVKKERGKKIMNGQTADDRKKLTLTPLDF